jgi:hypothetical protein
MLELRSSMYRLATWGGWLVSPLKQAGRATPRRNGADHDIKPTRNQSSGIGAHLQTRANHLPLIWLFAATIVRTILYPLGNSTALWGAEFRSAVASPLAIHAWAGDWRRYS